MRIAGSATILLAKATIDFAPTTNTTTDNNVTVPGAEVGDIVLLGVPVAAAVTGASFSAFVSAANTVKVRFNATGTSIDPLSGVFTVAVLKEG